MWNWVKFDILKSWISFHYHMIREVSVQDLVFMYGYLKLSIMICHISSVAVGKLNC